MTSSNEKGSASLYVGSERRNQPHLREVFEQAYRVAYPLLDSRQVLKPEAGSAHFLRVVLHDNFPNLHLQDISILSVSIERVYRERSKNET
jgi:hypothetical protein